MVGIFLGSFDPPHIGHLNVIIEALDSKIVDKVIVVPAYQNPWKSSTEYHLRYKMCQDMVALYNNVEVSDIESEGYTPTYKVIEKLKKIYPDMLIITTTETIEEIPKWIKGEMVLERNNFLICSSTFNPYPIKEGNYSIPIPSIEVSSTLIRKKIKEGKIVSHLVPTLVQTFINHDRLYK